MADKNLPLRKTVYTKEQLGRIFDTEFTEFQDDPGLGQDDLDLFFRLYNDLFFDIPLTGNNSHELLLRRSSEVTRLDEAPLDIQPLLDEIASLRRQLLDANRRILELEIQGIAQGEEISLEEFLALQNQIASLQGQLAQANASIADLERQLAEGTASSISTLLEGGLELGEGGAVAEAEAAQQETIKVQEMVKFIEVEQYERSKAIRDKTKKRKKRERRLDFLRTTDLIKAAKAKRFENITQEEKAEYIVKGGNTSFIKNRVLFRLNNGRVEFSIK